MATNIKPEQVKLLRDLTGLGRMDCETILQLAQTPDYAGDVVLAIASHHANHLAVHVHGSRSQWNLSKARATAPGLRSRNPDLDRAFPQPGPRG